MPENQASGTRKYIIAFGLERTPEDRYRANAECLNCHTREHVFILKGTPTKDVDGIECRNCGCKEFTIYA
jgi:Zn ribbon nucleic-acid-binding protein